MLREQGGHRLQGAFDLRLICWRVRVGRLQIDPQRGARLPTRLRQIRFPVIADDRLRSDYRSGGRIGQPLIDIGQMPMRQHRPRHPQRVRPPWSHRLRGQCPGQQQCGIHRLGGGSQHRGWNRACRIIDHACQLNPVRRAVIEDHPHIQWRGIDLDHLTRPGHCQRAKWTVRLLGQRPPGACRPERVPTFRQSFDDAIERPL